MASAAAVTTTVPAGPGERIDDAVVLRAEQVTKVFPGTLALDHVDFNVYRGKVNALIGENGAGKSTLMKIVAGVERPTSGRLLLDGKSIHLRSPLHAERFGIFIGLWAPTLLILSNRFDRYADKAKPLPGQMVKDEEPG